MDKKFYLLGLILLIGSLEVTMNDLSGEFTGFSLSLKLNSNACFSFSLDKTVFHLIGGGEIIK